VGVCVCMCGGVWGCVCVCVYGCVCVGGGCFCVGVCVWGGVSPPLPFKFQYRVTDFN